MFVHSNNSPVIRASNVLGNFVHRVRRFLARRKTRKLLKKDEEAEMFYGTKDADSVERVALLSLWQHAMTVFPAQFSYLTCLDPGDRLHFQYHMIEILLERYKYHNERREFVLSGVMDIEMWISVMRSIRLSENYSLWRHATVNEDSTNNVLSNKHVLIQKIIASGGDRHTLTHYVLYTPHLTQQFHRNIMLFPQPKEHNFDQQCLDVMIPLDTNVINN